LEGFIMVELSGTKWNLIFHELIAIYKLVKQANNLVLATGCIVSDWD